MHDSTYRSATNSCVQPVWFRLVFFAAPERVVRAHRTDVFDVQLLLHHRAVDHQDHSIVAGRRGECAACSTASPAAATTTAAPAATLRRRHFETDDFENL